MIVDTEEKTIEEESFYWNSADYFACDEFITVQKKAEETFLRESLYLNTQKKASLILLLKYLISIF